MDTDELAAVLGIIIACIVKRRQQRRKRADRKRKIVMKECAKKRQKLGNMLGNVEFVDVDKIHVKEEPGENEENEDITLPTVKSELDVRDQSPTEEEPGEKEENEDITLPTVKSELEIHEEEIGKQDVHEASDDDMDIDVDNISQPNITKQCIAIKSEASSKNHLDHIVTTVASVTNSTVSKRQRDEFSIFGDFVASELRQISHDEYALVTTKNKICQAIFNAQLSIIGRERCHSSYPLHPTIQNSTSMQTHTPPPSTPLQICSTQANSTDSK
ncbi:uncharacterized protein [Periplaneta americana]|uniref:uncharacterized protein isoform X2 n=1 Tax=Periplaneta americana TaxID=6978 RepID=UPI0037E99A20